MAMVTADRASKHDPLITACVAIAALTCTAGTLVAYRAAPQQAAASQPPAPADVAPLQPLWLSPREGQPVESSFGCLVASLCDHQDGDVLRVVELVEGRAVAVLGALAPRDALPPRLDQEIRCQARHSGPTTLACRLYRGGVPVGQSEPLQVVVGD